MFDNKKIVFINILLFYISRYLLCNILTLHCKSNNFKELLNTPKSNNEFAPEYLLNNTRNA